MEIFNFIKRLHDKCIELSEGIVSDKKHLRQLYLVALYGSLIELTGSLITLIQQKHRTGVATIFRSILEAFVELKNLHEKAEYVKHMLSSYNEQWITGTKNNKRRHVDMTPHLAETLKAFRTEQKKRTLKKGRPFPDWVFANRKKKMLWDIALRNALKRCLKDAKLKQIKVHDLRHSYATIRLLKGHNVGDVSYQLGYSSIQITYDAYGHWIPGQLKSEIDELDQMHPNAPKCTPGAPGKN
jgi:site-specific recombinase XerC